ncbi:unnamed protein product, partial [Symbiodinium microadriaticum]
AADQRRRLVGIWRQVDAVATLEAATLITEELQRTSSEADPDLSGESFEEDAEKPAAEPDPDGWYALGPDTFALMPKTAALDREAMAVGLAWRPTPEGTMVGLLIDFAGGELRVRTPS